MSSKNIYLLILTDPHVMWNPGQQLVGGGGQKTPGFPQWGNQKEAACIRQQKLYMWDIPLNALEREKLQS